MILIITNKEDVHPSPVIDIFTRWRVPFFRLNTEALLSDYEFCWWADERGTDFEITCPSNGLSITGSDISAVWDRRPEIPKELFINNTPEVNKHNLEEALGFLSFLRYYIKDIPSIGSITMDRIASSKMLQYKIAQEVGFYVPKTVFTNRKRFVEAFLGTASRLAIKSIENTDIWDETAEQDYVFYTQTLDGSQLRDIPDEAFYQTVSFIQCYEEKAFELRVTVVGTDVFAAKIDSQKYHPGKGAEDWRQAEEQDAFLEEFTLSEIDKQKCIRMVQALSLTFGCFDFIVRPDGCMVFLECNPNGQWLWVEMATKMPISESIARHLANAGLDNA